MRTFSLFVIAALIGPALANATVCKKGGQEFTLEIVTTEPGKKVPCEVKRTRNGEEKVFWNAQNDPAYCESKAQEYIAKMTGEGWACDGAEAAAGAAQTAPETSPAATPTK